MVEMKIEFRPVTQSGNPTLFPTFLTLTTEATETDQQTAVFSSLSHPVTCPSFRLQTIGPKPDDSSGRSISCSPQNEPLTGLPGPSSKRKPQNLQALRANTETTAFDVRSLGPVIGPRPFRDWLDGCATVDKQAVRCVCVCVWCW